MQQWLPWILASSSLALLAMALLLQWIRRSSSSVSRPLPTEWTLTPRPVFTADERRVYRQLREALPHQIVLSKLPLVRFCQPTDPNEVRFWYELLGAIHVTFAVCSANGRVLAAIDLESERSGARRASQIKQSVLAACRVRYLRCQPDRLPSIPELQLLVPQTAQAARGPNAAPAVTQARDVLASTVAARRRERTTLWQDSGFLQDSFFGVDSSRGELSTLSGFGALRTQPGMTVHEVREASEVPEGSPAPHGDGGVVIDAPPLATAPAANLRH
jgi:hypothetical protein